MKNLFLIPISLLIISLTYSQTTTVSKQKSLIKSNHNYGLTNPLFNKKSPMTYNPSDVNTKGAAFSINYINQGGTNFDGYPSGNIGGFKTGGTYYSGNKSTSGMPIQIKDLKHNLRINWKTSQTNANDSDDKWWATINVIFDNGTQTSEPVLANRDYDLVIQNVSYKQDDLTDFNNPGGRYWYFARNNDDTIKPFTLYLNGTSYSWAVRYKFFDYPPGHTKEDKNDKVHIKFIPINNSKPIPNLDHSLKSFIDCTKDYIQYLDLTTSELTLANSKVAIGTLWIKSIAAGYEVYEGTSTLANEYFYTTLDNTAPAALINLSATEEQDGVFLTWDISSDAAFDTYVIYRSENGGPYNAIKTGLRINNYTDNTIATGTATSYDYYVTAKDRSFNESSQSNIVTYNTLSIDEQIKKTDIEIYPNPTKSLLSFKFNHASIENGKIQIFDITGRLMKTKLISGTTMVLQLDGPPGIYIAKIQNGGSSMIRKIIKH